MWKVQFYNGSFWSTYDTYDNWQEACNIVTWLEWNGNPARKIKIV